jgi:crossover junction endodeoxyribonuclease RuvC
MKIIGIDPGLAATGVGIVCGSGLRARQFSFGSITTTPSRPLPHRLDHIYSKLIKILQEAKPDAMVVEDVFSLDRFPKSGITLGKVTGVVLLAGSHAGIPVMEVAVREAKQVLTGNGNASKAQLEMAVRRSLGCAVPIKPYHASDALGLALIGLFRAGRAISGWPISGVAVKRPS